METSRFTLDCRFLDIFYSVNNDGNIIQNLVFEYYPNTLQNILNEKKEKRKYTD